VASVSGALAQTNPIQLTQTNELASLNDQTVVAVQQPNGPLSHASLPALKSYVFSESALPAANLTGTGTNVLAGLQAATNSANGFLTGGGAATALGLQSAAYQPTTAFDAAGAAATALASAQASGLQRSNNLSDIASAATARTNLGLGSAATQPATAFDAAGAAATAQATAISTAEAASLQRANNLSDIASAATARTNLGLGSAATQPTTAFDAAGTAATAQSTAISTAEAASLQRSNNLSDIASAATARTNLGLNGTGFAAAAANPVNTTGGLATYQIASSSTLGLVKPDNASILVNGSGTLTATAASVGACALTGCTYSGPILSSGSATFPLYYTTGANAGYSFGDRNASDTATNLLYRINNYVDLYDTTFGNLLSINAVTGATVIAGSLTAGVSYTAGLAVNGCSLTGLYFCAAGQAAFTGVLSIQSGNQFGGAYGGELELTNTSSGATNPNKIIRLGSTGDLQIVNSANSSIIADLTDAGVLNLTQTPTVNGVPLANSSSTYSAGSCLTLSGTVFSLTASCSTLTNYATLSGATFTGPVNGTLASFSGSGWQYFLGNTVGNTGSAFPAGTAAGGLGVAWNVTNGQAEVDFLNRTNLGDPSGFAFYQQPAATGTPTQIAYLGSAEDTFPEPIYGTGSTNTLSCPVNFDSNGPTAELCAITSTTASGNKSQWGWMVSNTSNAVSTSGAEAGALYVANNCLSGAPKCWGMALTNVSEAGSAGGQALELISANGSCDPGVPWHPTTSCITPTIGMLIDGVGNSTSNVYAGEAAFYIVNSSTGAIFHAGMFIGNNPGGASSVDQCAVCDYSGDYTVMRVGGTHTHFYYPESNYTPASYTSTMWDGELTIGDSSESGPMISVANSTATCVGSPSTGAFGWSCSSDARLKTDYGPDGDELAYINSLPIDRYKVNATGEITVGPIAQQLQKVHPEMVHEVEDDLIPADKENAAGTMLSADQPNIWKLTRGIQEVWSHDLDQDAEIAALKALTRRQQSQIAALSSGARWTPANDNGVLGFLRHLIAR
jgi:hypothetical protein